MKLSDCPTEQLGSVVAVSDRDPALGRRLGELGLRVGARVTLLRRTSGGGAIVAIGDDRLALARVVLRAVEVEVPDPARSGA